jgi:hypothetical protein
MSRCQMLHHWLSFSRPVHFTCIMQECHISAKCYVRNVFFISAFKCRRSQNYAQAYFNKPASPTLMQHTQHSSRTARQTIHVHTENKDRGKAGQRARQFVNKELQRIVQNGIEISVYIRVTTRIHSTGTQLCDSASKASQTCQPHTSSTFIYPASAVLELGTAAWNLYN